MPQTRGSGDRGSLSETRQRGEEGRAAPTAGSEPKENRAPGPGSPGAARAGMGVTPAAQPLLWTQGQLPVALCTVGMRREAGWNAHDPISRIRTRGPAPPVARSRTAGSVWDGRPLLSPSWGSWTDLPCSPQLPKQGWPCAEHTSPASPEKHQTPPGACPSLVSQPGPLRPRLPLGLGLAEGDPWGPARQGGSVHSTSPWGQLARSERQGVRERGSRQQRELGWAWDGVDAGGCGKGTCVHRPADGCPPRACCGPASLSPGRDPAGLTSCQASSLPRWPCLLSPACPMGTGSGLPLPGSPPETNLSSL